LCTVNPYYVDKGRRLMRALLLAALLTGCAATAAPTESHDIDGTFTLHAQEGNFASNCTGDGGYSDIARGMGLTLKDGEGKILATTRLGSGEATDDRQECVFDFTFTDVPDAEFYVLESSRRGEQTYSIEDLEAADWTLSLEIGE
jgi:hypothetical protein